MVEESPSPAAAPRGFDIFTTSRPLWQTMLVFLVPLMLSNLLQSASGTFNSIFLGRFIGVHALAAVSSIFPVVFFLVSFMIGISSGSTVLIGQAYGARDEHKLKRIAGTTIGVGFYFSILTCVLGVVFARDLLEIIRTPSDILTDATAYSRIVWLSLPILFPYLIYTTVIRGTGDSRTPFYFLIVSTALSAVLTPALIFGWLWLPKIGVLSAAVANFAASFIAFAGLLVYLQVLRSPLRVDRELIADMVNVDWGIFLKVVRIGIPTGIQVVMVSLSEIAVITFVNRFGSHATAAYGAVNQIVSYVQFPAISIGITASIFGAQSIGARREDMLGAVVRSAVTLNYVIGSVLIGLVYVFSNDVLGWFITDAPTLAVAHELVMITMWSYLLFGNSAVLSGIMRASGDVIVPTLNGIGAIWLVEVPAAYVLMQHFGLAGVWMGYPIAFAAALTAQFTYYTLVWKKKTHERLV